MAVDFLHHENPPTWAGVEPASLGAEGLATNQPRHLTVSVSDIDYHAIGPVFEFWRRHGLLIGNSGVATILCLELIFNYHSNLASEKKCEENRLLQDDWEVDYSVVKNKLGSVTVSFATKVLYLKNTSKQELCSMTLFEDLFQEMINRLS
ncbi:hypothetical protein TNCV_3371041 [Trichonephila clavipes]|nr:hypothetical protein TNCV_3371041 [Trichonephila clavipes]